MPETSATFPQRYQVYQRGKNGTATITFPADKPTRVQVRKGSKVIVPWKACRGRLTGVPTGGPYTLEFEIAKTRKLIVSDILVGDLWVLAGQSNMDGCARLVNLEPPSPMVRCFYYNEQWDIAQDPLCYVLDSVDPVHWSGTVKEEDLPEARAKDHKWRDCGGGLGVRFGKDLYKATGVPIGLVMCSHGGTSLEQWDAAKKNLGGQSLYGSMLRRVQACGGQVAGLAWYQGESDANEPLAPTYKERMKSFIAALRKDLKNPRLPFLQVQIGRFFVDEIQFPPKWWNQIQQAQLEVQRETKYMATAAAIDGSLSDAIHLDSISERQLGARLAELALVLQYGKKAPLSLLPSDVRFADKARTSIRVTYAHVRGALKPASGIQGFWIEDAAGERVAIVSAKASGAQVLLKLERPLQPGATLWYGRNTNPATNLQDRMFAAPVFGPVTLR